MLDIAVFNTFNTCFYWGFRIFHTHASVRFPSPAPSFHKPSGRKSGGLFALASGWSGAVDGGEECLGGDAVHFFEDAGKVIGVGEANRFSGLLDERRGNV